MAQKRDYYDVLGVPRDCSCDEVKKAYRRLARKHHPDVNHHDDTAEETFKEINEAYQVLSDSQKRQVYDTYGHEGLNGRMGDSGFGFGGFGDLGGFGDIFDMFFQGGARSGNRRAAESGADILHHVELTLEEAASGVEREIRVTRFEACEVCNSTGSSPGSFPETCVHCRGTGQISHTQRTFLGSFSTVAACAACGGTGRVIKHPCTACSGSGRLRATKERAISIPAGIEDGTRVRLRGWGDAGLRGAPAGDLYLEIRIRPHEIFERHGDDIICELPISFVQAALGDTIEVPCIDGTEKLHIPAGTQAGTDFKIKNRGMPNMHGGGRGTQHVIVRIAVPTKLTDEQKRLLHEYAKAEGIELEEAKGFFEKLLRK